jgi:hypothetical protein
MKPGARTDFPLSVYDEVSAEFGKKLAEVRGNALEPDTVATTCLLAAGDRDPERLRYYCEPKIEQRAALILREHIKLPPTYF